MKKKIRIEYPLNPSSGSIIWATISTPSGLQRWFADKVSNVGKLFTFQWGKTETRKAEVINFRTESFIRFHWADEDTKTFFELKLPTLQIREKKRMSEAFGIPKSKS